MFEALYQLLHAWRDGDRDALGTLIQQVHGELLRMAASRLRGAETPSLYDSSGSTAKIGNKRPLSQA